MYPVVSDPNLTGAPMGMDYMPPNMINGPQNFVFIEDPLTELAQSSGAIIRQDIELLEILTGCETQNRYHVFLQSPMGLKYAFKCNERSDTCARCCLSAECRPLQLIVRHIISLDQLSGDLAKIFARVDKPCECTCCCLCRPHMDVRLADSNICLGSVREPCTCCDLDVEVFDPSGCLRYEIIGDCCQIGLCCGPNMEKLANIRFDILQNRVPVGVLRKLSSSFGEFFSKADSYQVHFPPQASPEEKMMLIIAALMIDYQFFEKDNSEPHHHRPYYY